MENTLKTFAALYKVYNTLTKTNPEKMFFKFEFPSRILFLKTIENLKLFFENIVMKALGLLVQNEKYDAYG